jgi:hypothetical protein
MDEQDHQIIVGTTVRLRDIPGPLMRVLRLNNQQASCFWFSRHNEPCEEQFPIALLAKQNPYIHVPKAHPDDEHAADRFERETSPVADH